MILLALALAAQGQWTGPRTEEYRGPGNYCGGGYRVSLARGERALLLPQDTGGQAVRLVLSRGEVNIHTGVRAELGRTVMHYRSRTRPWRSTKTSLRADLRTMPTSRPCRLTKAARPHPTSFKTATTIPM